MTDMATLLLVAYPARFGKPSLVRPEARSGTSSVRLVLPTKHKHKVSCRWPDTNVELEHDRDMPGPAIAGYRMPPIIGLSCREVNTFSDDYSRVLLCIHQNHGVAMM
jgi:hypothetical protein